MGYHVKIEELLEVQNQMISQLSEWGTQLESVYQALETIVVTPCIQGETGKSIQNYIQEVHIPVIRSLQQLLTEFQVRLSVYAEGYYGIDSSYEAEIPQEILEEQQQALEKGREDFENLREEINSAISNVSDIVSVVQPSGLSLVLSYQLMESRVKTLNSDIGDYEETHQNDTQNMNSMLESIRSILIARTGSPAISVTNYQAGSIAMLPSYQRLQMEYEASGNFVAQNIAQYEAAMKKFEDKMNDKLADDRKAEGLKQFLSGIVSVTVGTALIFATAGAATPIVLSAAVVGGTSTLYGLSNATEGMNNISLGFSGDGFAVAENPIRDTLFAGNPELYYTIGNASTMISAMALPMSGILKGATGATKFKAIAVDGGRILIGNVAEDKVYDVIYQSTDSRILAMLGSNVVEGVLSGKPANSSVSEIGDIARKTDIEELGDDLIDLRRKGFDGQGKTLSPDDIRYQEYWKQKELLSKSTCSDEVLYEYLYKIDSDKAINYTKTGRWPSDIQIPSNTNVLNGEWGIDWSQVPKGGYVLDINGNPVKNPYNPQVGDVIDRYGPASGRYTSPVNGSPYDYDSRALPYVEDPEMYHQYQVVGEFKDIKSYVESCNNTELVAEIDDYVNAYYGGDYNRLIPQSGYIAEGFGSSGGGIQIELPMPVDMLEGIGILKEIN